MMGIYVGENALTAFWNGIKTKFVTSVNSKTGNTVQLDADDIPYDNSDSGLSADNLQDAVDELTTEISEAYIKPTGGIPKTDLASAVQTSLGKADTAIQASSLAAVATSGSYSDLLNTPYISHNLDDVESIQLLSNTETTGSTGNINLSIQNDGKTVCYGGYASGSNVTVTPFVSGSSGYWFLKVRDADTNAVVANTAIAYRVYVMRMK